MATKYAYHSWKSGCCTLPRACHKPQRSGGSRRKIEIANRPPPLFYGIDGEGQSKPDGSHNYVLLAAVDEFGQYPEPVAADRLATVHCVEFLLSLPRNIICFAFGFGYDRTKILEDCPNAILYRLVRPEKRGKLVNGFLKTDNTKWHPHVQNPKHSKPGDVVYDLGHQGSLWTFSRGTWRVDPTTTGLYAGLDYKKQTQTVKVWDLFKFYQSSFVKALEAWDVGTKELRERMQLMKQKRSEFDKEDPEAVKAYCLEECQCLAQLARKLVNAHNDASLKLKRFDGPGTSASLLLDRYDVKERRREPSDEMRHAVASAFFGGRFENSVVGVATGLKNGPLWGYDISSAYPYQQTHLPCLEHGQWRLTDRREDITHAKAAVVHYGFRPHKGKVHWGPFPFRTEDGTICCPIESGGGWIWRDEYVHGERLFPNVYFREAWVLESDCTCQIFQDLPSLYKRRLQIGKEGPGLVLKLAINSCYGKLAQSVGKAQYNCWIWAGLITSGCRSQILEAMGLMKNRRNLLAVATDGVYSRERLPMPKPRETGTAEVIEIKSGDVQRKPLGGWEEKECPGGTFFARPGIYFPAVLDPKDKKAADKVRARGIGRKDLFDYYQDMIRAQAEGAVTYKFPDLTRFIGMKTSITRKKRRDGGGHQYNRKPTYGTWRPYPVISSFDPRPKRGEHPNADGTLRVLRFPLDLESEPYDRAKLSPEARELKAMQEWLEDQPDPGDYDMGEIVTGDY